MAQKCCSMVQWFVLLIEIEGPVTGIPWALPSIIKFTCCDYGVVKQPPLFSSTNQWEFGTSMVWYCPISSEQLQIPPILWTRRAMRNKNIGWTNVEMKNHPQLKSKSPTFPQIKMRKWKIHSYIYIYTYVCIYVCMYM